MDKTLTFEQFIELAKKHYHRGGDSFVECWERTTFNAYVEMFEPITKRTALQMFRDNFDEEMDERGMREF